jgi:hypothetical protein
MISSVEVKNQIINQLKTLPVCKPSSNMRNWVVRCPYCGDSLKSNHGHFSILIDLNSDAPLLYRCFRCNEAGILIPQVLEDLNLGYDQSLNQQLSIMNRLSSNSSYFKDKIKNFIVPVPADTAKNRFKLNYINNRIGVNLTFSDCADYKTILSFSEFIRVNNIPVDIPDPTGGMLKSTVVRTLDDKYLGFVSANNNKIVFRDVSPDGSGFLGRYYKVTLDVFNRSPNTFYSLMSKFNLLYTEPINVYIAEGTFDILSVYLNLQPETSQNTLFFASCGYSFSTILKYLIYTGVNTDINLHVYSDSDKSDKDHLRLLQKPFYRTWLDNIIIHRNMYQDQKDFGVSGSEISDYAYMLKI